MSKFYGYEGQELLSLDPEDVVKDLMENDGYSDFPIEVHVFKQREPFSNVEDYANSILEDILESLDEEYSDPDGDWTEPTENMKKAAIHLVDVLKKEFRVWLCEPTGEIIKYSKEDAEKIAGVQE